LHVLITIGISYIGSRQIFPQLFDQHGLGYFNVDNLTYLELGKTLSGYWRNGDLNSLMNHPSTMHIKVYALSMALFSPLIGFSVLSAELVNLAYYLVILWFVYSISKGIFGERSGLFAMVAVGLWPSFIIHTTQLLRDPLFIVGMLTIIFIMGKLISAEVNFQTGFVNILLCGFALMLVGSIGVKRWPLALAVVFLGVVFLFLQMLRKRKLWIWNSLSGIMLLVFSLSGFPTQSVSLSKIQIEAFFMTSEKLQTVLQDNTDYSAGSTSNSVPSDEVDNDKASSVEVDDQNNAPNINYPVDSEITWWDPWAQKIDAIASQIGTLRYGFVISYPNASSNIDAGYEIHNAKDLLRYLPRALAIGLFAPFPGMWFEVGMTGASTRVLSAVETFVIYIIEIVAVIGIWKNRQRLEIWYILAIILVSSIGLGLVVINTGTLFRMRYSFWMLVIILGVGGFQQIFRPYFRRKF